MKFVRFIIILVVGIVQIEGNAIRKKIHAVKDGGVNIPITVNADCFANWHQDLLGEGSPHSCNGGQKTYNASTSNEVGDGESNKVVGESSSKSETMNSKNVVKGATRTGSSSLSEAQLSGRGEELDSDADDNDDHVGIQQSGGSDSKAIQQSEGNPSESAGGSVIMQQHAGDGTLSSSTSSQDGGSDTIIMQQVVIQPGQKYIVHQETREIEIISQQPIQVDVDQSESAGQYYVIKSEPPESSRVVVAPAYSEVSSSLKQGSTGGGSMSTVENSGTTQQLQHQIPSNNGGKVIGRSKLMNKKSARFNTRQGLRSERKNEGGVNIPITVNADCALNWHQDAMGEGSPHECNTKRYLNQGSGQSVSGSTVAATSATSSSNQKDDLVRQQKHAATQSKQGPEVDMGQPPQESKVITYQGKKYVAGYPATDGHTIIIPPGWTVVRQSGPQVATDQHPGQSDRETLVTYEHGGLEGGNRVAPQQAQQSLVTDMQPGQKITMQRTDAIVLQETKQVVLPPGQHVELKPSEELVQVVQTGGEGTTLSPQQSTR